MDRRDIGAAFRGFLEKTTKRDESNCVKNLKTAKRAKEPFLVKRHLSLITQLISRGVWRFILKSAKLDVTIIGYLLIIAPPWPRIATGGAYG